MLSNVIKSLTLVLIGTSLLWAAPEKISNKVHPQNLPVMGGSNEPVVDLPVAPEHPTHYTLDDYVGIIDTAGFTYYDYQHNGSCGKMIDVDGQDRISMVWMNGLNAASNPRYVYYNVWDPAIEDFLYDSIGVRIDASQRAGYVSQTTNSDGFCFPAFHEITVGDIFHSAASIDYASYADAFTTVEPAWCYEGGQALELDWPKIDMDINGNLHMMSTENPLSGDAGEPQRIYYSRGVPEFDGGFGVDINWDAMSCGGYEVWDTVMTISVVVACSRHSERCAVAWSHSMEDLSDDPIQQNNNIYLRISEDGGLNWGNRINVTNFIPWDPACYHGGGDPLECDHDTLRAYMDCAVLFDEQDNIHIAFTTISLFWYLPGESDSIWSYTNHSLVWHWGENVQKFSLLADGWYSAYDCGAWQRNVQRPSLAIDPVTNNLFCSYQKHDAAAYSESGYSMADAFVTVSTDNGKHWAVGTNVTNTTSSMVPAPSGTSMHERDITIAPLVTEYNGTHYIHMEYILDKDAGGFPLMEGVVTRNPVIYQRIPTYDIATSPQMPERTFHAGEEDAAGTVILQSENPPGTWNYALSHDAGTIVEWRYEGATITNAWVDGAAAADYWIVVSQTESEVVFRCGAPLIEGTLEGFHIQGTNVGTGDWSCGDSSGTVEGPLPVEMTTFQAVAGDGQVTLRWRTESESDNDHFVLYKRRTGEDDFHRLTEVLGHGTTTEPYDYQFIDSWVQNGITYEYQISDVDIAGRETFYEHIISATPSRDIAPTEFALHQNYPNPFNPTTTIRYDVKEAGLVSLKVFDVLGREVAVLTYEEHAAGSYEIAWDASDLPSGIYLCKMDAEGFVQTQKMVLLK
ncbi:T9SS type A sorting domain-containing protein [bacterium]|nr:T9SS type A sorting domain-containing protein [bacterium]